MRIVHIITSLGDGGAEHTLFKICKYDQNNKHIVICLKGPEKYFPLLKNLGIEVYCLNLKFFSINKFFSLVGLLNNLKPDVVQTWLVHADFIGGIAARLAGIKYIVWNIRYSNFKIGKAKLLTILIIKVLSKLSFHIPKLIIVNSKKAKKIFSIEGYCKKKLRFIPNGFDLSILKPQKFQQKIFKKKFKIKKTLPLIGNVARYDKKKDHLNLLNALAIIQSKNINFFCLLVGSNMDKKNIKITTQIKKLNLSNNVKLLGQINNTSQVMSGFDIFVQSSSYGEGFPNVLAESMACQTPCIATDVGDSAFIIGKTGWIAPPSNPKYLSKKIELAINEIKTKKWNKRCTQARSRIRKHFHIRKMIRSYNEIWSKFRK
jgi:glycosyltransferase involved in cell wall biosynthesis